MTSPDRELWTTKQAAAYCNIRPYLVHQYRNHNGFPAPVSRVASRAGEFLFEAAAVRLWQASRRGPGRRRVPITTPSTKDTT